MRKTWIIAIIGLASFVILVWFAGPRLIIAGQAPLASAGTRVLLAAAFILQYLAHKLWSRYQARRSNDRVLANLTPSLLPQVSPEAALLRERFAAALEQLRSARFGAQHRVRSSLRWKFGRAYLYQLPWYMIIGAPGAGKTTALLNSGLHFPLGAKLGRGPIAGFGGTRNCDWWFTDSAVLIDTAGRYTTQDSDRDADANAWRDFLGLLRDARPKRPLNGVLVAVSVSDLLSYTAGQLLEHAHTIRSRLDELQIALHLRMPVYVLLTKCDLLPGFVEWFGTLDRSDRDAIWGVTLDLPTAHAGQSAAHFAPAFQGVVNQLTDKLVQRLEAERDPQRRARIFALPRQLRALGEPLDQLIKVAFGAPSKALRASLLRGVYLTSGTQEGTPIDRMLSALGREIGLEQQILPPNQSSGKSFFLARLLTDVVFAEADLNGRAPLRQRLQHRLMFSSIAVVQIGALAVCGWWIANYLRSVEDIERLDARVARAQLLVASLSTNPDMDDTDPRSVLLALDAVRALAHDDRPLQHRSELLDLGAGAREKLCAAAHDSYRRLLLGPFQSRIAAAVGATLRNGADINVQYEALKTYAMLTDDRHFDAAGFRIFVISYWNSALAPPLATNERQRLEQHLDALLGAGVVGSGIRWQPTLVESVRSRLRTQSAAQRIELRIAVLLANHPFADITPTSLGINGLLATSSANNPSAVVAGRFTIDAYRDLVNPEVPVIAAQLLTEAPWVLASTRTDATRDALRDAADFMAIYRANYTQAWTQFTDSLQFKPPMNNNEALQQLEALAAPAGPLARLLGAVVRQTPTRLSNGDAGPISPDASAAARFTDLAALVNQNDEGNSMTKGLVNSLRELASIRTPAKRSVAGTAETLSRESRLAQVVATAKRQPPPVRSLLLALAVLPADEFPDSSPAALSSQIANRLGMPCVRLVAGQFPFDRRAPRDASLKDFAKMFGPKGEFAAVSSQLMAAQVNTSSDVQSTRTQGIVDARNLQRFRAAAQIRAVFFGHDAAQPRLKLTFRPLDMDQEIDRFTLEIDGQSVNYAHGPATPTVINWPGSNGSAYIDATPTNSGRVEYSGPWALFRLFDHAAIQETDTPGRFNVVFDISGRHASFQVDSDTPADPFRLRELEQVDCPIAGQ